MPRPWDTPSADCLRAGVSRRVHRAAPAAGPRAGLCAAGAGGPGAGCSARTCCRDSSLGNAPSMSSSSLEGCRWWVLTWKGHSSVREPRGLDVPPAPPWSRPGSCRDGGCAAVALQGPTGSPGPLHSCGSSLSASLPRSSPSAHGNPQGALWGWGVSPRQAPGPR